MHYVCMHVANKFMPHIKAFWHVLYSLSFTNVNRGKGMACSGEQDSEVAHTRSRSEIMANKQHTHKYRILLLFRCEKFLLFSRIALSPQKFFCEYCYQECLR